MNTKNKTFLVLGGDLRQIYLADKLSESFTVYTYATDTPSGHISSSISLSSLAQINKGGGVDVLVLPLLATQDGVTVETPFYQEKILISDLLGLVKKGGVVLGGKLPPDVIAFFEENSVAAIDYFENEELQVRNSTPTAEGALMIALEELHVTVFGSRVLITGYGRVAKATAKLFQALGAEVTVTARRYSELAWAELFGCRGIHLSEINKKLGEYDAVINTVPAVVLNEERLSLLKPDCLVIDLASKPGGVDYETAKKSGVKVIWALSLPGKVAPVSAGEIIASTIVNILNERGGFK